MLLLLLNPAEEIPYVVRKIAGAFIRGLETASSDITSPVAVNGSYLRASKTLRGFIHGSISASGKLRGSISISGASIKDEA